MKRLLVTALFALVSVAAMPQDCYKSTRQQGIDYYNQGKKSEAKRYFVAAQSCPDKPANNDLQSWINKCNVTPTPKPHDNTVVNTVSVDRVCLVNTETGEAVSPRVYSGDVSNMAPRICYSGKTSYATKITLLAKLIDPNGNTIRNSSSPSGGYTSSRDVLFKSDVPDSVTMPSFSNYKRGGYLNGEYTYEVYYNRDRLYSFRFNVVPDRAILVINGMGNGDVISELDYQGGPITYSIESNDSYEVEDLPDWISISSRSENKLEITVSENYNVYKKEDFFWVKTTGLKRKITIKQAGRLQVQNNEPKETTQKVAVATAKPKFEFGASFLISMTSASFSSKSTQSVINYGVNDLVGVYTDPDYKPGVGFNVFFNYYQPITKNFYLGTGLGISNGGFSNEFKDNGWQYTASVDNTVWYPEQQSKETYRLTYLDIPIRAAFELPLGGKTSLVFKGGFILGIGLSGTCKVESTIFQESDRGYMQSELTGDVNLFTGKYTFEQQYSTGAANKYSIDGKAENPYNRVNFSLNLGADIVLNKFVIGLEYNIGLSNIANSKYWGDAHNQVSGFYVSGVAKYFSGSNDLVGYKQRLSSLNIKLSYRF